VGMLDEIVPACQVCSVTKAERKGRPTDSHNKLSPDADQASHRPLIWASRRSELPRPDSLIIVLAPKHVEHVERLMDVCSRWQSSVSQARDHPIDRVVLVDHSIVRLHFIIWKHTRPPKQSIAKVFHSSSLPCRTSLQPRSSRSKTATRVRRGRDHAVGPTTASQQDPVRGSQAYRDDDAAGRFATSRSE
jgi:hypothetical protein